jgi:hypothetical protein
MEDKSRYLLEILRNDDRLSWIVEQLTASYAEGISQSAKDTASPILTEIVDVQSLSRREKAKREKYETSRPYSSEEKLDLSKFALKEVFLTLPAMKAATFNSLRELGSTATSIEFTVPDEEDRAEGSYTEEVTPTRDSQEDLKRRINEFLQRITP